MSAEPIYIAVIDNASGTRDVELLDAPPTDSFLDELRDAVAGGTILRAEIRAGHINGGDSSIEWSTP